MDCEQHIHSEWPHGDECAGPGVMTPIDWTWIIVETEDAVAILAGNPTSGQLVATIDASDAVRNDRGEPGTELRLAQHIVDLHNQTLGSSGGLVIEQVPLPDVAP
jgi:hypothetical protein